MTEKEAIEEITSELKWYIGVMPQSTASNFIQSYRRGMAKKKTINKFLRKFGYEIKQEEQWEKIKKHDRQRKTILQTKNT